MSKPFGTLPADRQLATLACAASFVRVLASRLRHRVQLARKNAVKVAHNRMSRQPALGPDRVLTFEIIGMSKPFGTEPADRELATLACAGAGLVLGHVAVDFKSDVLGAAGRS